MAKTESVMIPAAPGGFIYATYDGYWDGEEWPTAKEEITVEVCQYPVIGFLCELPLNQDYVPLVKAVYLDDGSIHVEDRIPFDMGEEGVHLGTYLTSVRDSELVKVAVDRCWNRCSMNRRQDGRETKPTNPPSSNPHIIK